jgi:hypothetical protein
MVVVLGVKQEFSIIYTKSKSLAPLLYVAIHQKQFTLNSFI